MEIIIGIAGSICSGKTTVARAIKRRGYHRLSTGHSIKEDIRKSNGSITRQSMQYHGYVLGVEGSPVDKLRERIFPDTNYVISSICNSEQAILLSNRYGSRFSLVYVDAELEKRFEYNQMSKSPLTLSEFELADYRDRTGKIRGDGQHSDGLKNLAEYHINNNGSIPQLHKEVRSIVENIERVYSWDKQSA